MTISQRKFPSTSRTRLVYPVRGSSQSKGFDQNLSRGFAHMTSPSRIWVIYLATRFIRGGHNIALSWKLSLPLRSCVILIDQANDRLILGYLALKRCTASFMCGCCRFWILVRWSHLHTSPGCLDRFHEKADESINHGAVLARCWFNYAWLYATFKVHLQEPCIAAWIHTCLLIETNSNKTNTKSAACTTMLVHHSGMI